MKLERQDITALKTCDAVCFYYRKDVHSLITAVKRPSKKNAWEQRHDIPVGYSFSGREAEYVTRCFEMIDHVEWVPEALTWINFLRAGDELTLRWRVANQCDILNENKLYRDELFLDIRRGKKQYTFFLRSAVRYNNSARMIQF